MSHAQANRSKRGATLLEMILVVALIGGLMAAVTPVVRVVNMGWQTGERRIEVIQNARVAMDETVRGLRQARRVSAVSDPGDATGYLEFYDQDDTLHRLDLDGLSGFASLGPVGGQAILAGPMSALEFSCFDASNTLISAPVPTHQIRSVEISMTTADAENRVPTYNLRSKVYMRRDAAVVINEIMYNPVSIFFDYKFEWVELLNLSDRAFDLSGWTLTSWTNRNNPDFLEGETRFGTGSTLLPVGGYAVITSDDSFVYAETLINRGFESNPWMFVWTRSSGWSRSNGGAHEGNRKLTRSGPGWVYQTTYIPNLSRSAFCSFWERTPSGAPQNMRLVVTLRNLGNTVLATIYDGPMHTDWTRHYMNLTAYKGNWVKLRFETIGAGEYWLDDCSMSWSLVDQNAVRIKVDDSRIGGGLRNNWDTVTISQGNLAVDVVSYDDSWGGDGNTRSLERISPTGGSSDSANWTQGPWFGTPSYLNNGTP